MGLTEGVTMLVTPFQMQVRVVTQQQAGHHW